MSRAGFRFLRILLPSGNSRVSVTLNRLIRALFRKGFSRALFRRGFSVHSFAGAFPVASFAGALTVHSFVGAFSLRCFAGTFPVRFFAEAFSVRCFARAFPVRSFVGAFFMRSFAGVFSVRCFAGNFSVRPIKLAVFNHRIVSRIWYVGCLLFEFFSIIARCVLDQFWGSPRGNQQIRDWINWNWNH